MLPIVHTLYDSDVARNTPPEPGYEWMVHRRVVTTLELAWPDAKVAVALTEQVAGNVSAQLADAGWRVFTMPFEMNGLIGLLK